MKLPLSEKLLSPLVYLSNNALSFLGVLLATTGGVSWFFVLPAELSGAALHPYLGILAFLILPGLFFAGLALIPAGIYLRLRNERRRGIYPQEFPPLDWANREFRRLVVFIGVVTLANVIIGGNFTYSAVNYMDSVNFCGQSCHTVMKPEFTAYQDSPHFRVKCVECHIGAGASWFVKSKISGVRQVFAVIFNTYSRPIPTPVHDLRPARETCEECHWPQKFGGYRLRILPKFAEDEPNTATKTVLLMKIGGGSEIFGIHGVHLGPGVVIEYLSDHSRQTIPWVRYTDGAARSAEFTAKDWNPREKGKLERRTMDCLDCHSRPSHAFEMPETALDKALAASQIPASLPFVRREGARILKAAYASSAEAARGIPAALDEFYRKERPAVYGSRREDLQKAGRALVAIFNRNVFPEMKITWGTYPNNIGHTDFPGCFRCHDDQHASKEGKTVPQDCSACHQLVAMDEAKPEILGKLGIE